jgi:lipid-A-disaccharide synthase
MQFPPVPKADRPILVTAFEPSGDEHASILIEELLRRRPDLRIIGWGNRKMAAAGAEIVEKTGEHAVMGIPGPKVIREHIALNKRIGAWIETNRPALHIPVDSPAANFPVCKHAKARGVRVVHLVAPQLWAWGHWRVRKLRRLTDHVMCVLPFEEEWFRAHAVPATFVGHPLWSRPIDDLAIDAKLVEFGEALPGAAVRIGVFPGSRPSEAEKNFPIMLAALREISAKRAHVGAICAATTDDMLARLRRIASEHNGWPANLHPVVHEPDAVIRWSDVALTVSGTNSLRITKHRTPMVIMFRAGAIQWNLLGRWLLKSPFLSLPNLVAGERIVPELMPLLRDDPAPVVREVTRLLDDRAAWERQRDSLDRVATRFESANAAERAADVVLSFLEG